jgi:hypothetical protein
VKQSKLLQCVSKGFTVNNLKITIVTAVSTLALAGCGGGGGSSASVVSNLAGITVDNVTTPTQLYVADFGLSLVKSIPVAGGASTVLAGQSGVSGAANNTTGTSATFYGVEGLTLVGTNLYAVDALNCGLRTISTTAPYAVSTAAGILGTCDNSDNNSATSAKFNTPRNVAVDRTTGDLYVTDSVNNTIRKISSAGVVSTIASGFNSPWGIVSDNTSPPTLYVTDVGNNSIKKVSNTAGTWSVSTFAGSVGGTAGLPANANGTSATFNFPLGITIDGTFANLYVVDGNNNVIRQIAIAAPQTVTLIAGSNAGKAGNAINATGTSATFSQPTGIAYGGNNLYVIDQNGTSIKVISTAAPYPVTKLTIN